MTHDQYMATCGARMATADFLAGHQLHWNASNSPAYRNAYAARWNEHAKLPEARS